MRWISQGIQWMIISIAVLAGGVIFVMFLTHTLETQRDRTYTTEKQSIAYVGGTSLKVLEISVEKGDSTTEDSTKYFFIRTKLAPDSSKISAQGIHIELTMENQTKSYTYNSRINCTQKEQLYLEENKDYFGMEHILERSDGTTMQGILAQYEIAEICFGAPRALLHDEKIGIEIIPAEGTTFSAEQDLPESFPMERTIIYSRK